MRVSLQIDGDASGAKQAAEETSAAISDLGQKTDSSSSSMEAAFKKASGALDGVKNSSQAAGAANDNTASAIAGVVQKVGELASKTLGADSAFTKAASGASSLIDKVGAFAKTAGALPLLSGGIGIATAAISTFYDIANSGSAKAEKHLQDQAALIGKVRDAFSDATNKAGEFFNETKKTTEALLLINTAKLTSDLADSAKSTVSKFNNAQVLEGISNSVDPFGDLNRKGVESYAALEKAVSDYNATIVAGTPNVRAYQDALSDLYRTNRDTNPEVAKLAAQFLEESKASGDVEAKIRRNKDALDVLNGTATETQRRNVGITASTNDATNSFERFIRSIERQAAAQEAESNAVGGSVGNVTRLRTESVLLQAAQQAGGDTAAKYADQIAKVAARAGEATQKLAEAKLQSDLAFDRSQLGRTADDQAVASQLRGAFGDNADLNGTIASTIRLNNDLKELKSTTQDLASGAFRDFRNELMNGATAFQALEKAGVNALARIADKLLDKTLDNALSGLFGMFLGGGSGSSGSIAIGNYMMPKIGWDTGGWTGAGRKYDVAGVVHRDEYVFNKEATNRIGVANLDRLHRGVGFADGGYTGGSAPWSGFSASGGGIAASSSPIAVKVSVGVSVDGDGNIKAMVKDVSTQVANDSIGQFVTSPAYEDHFAQTYKTVKSQVKV